MQDSHLHGSLVSSHFLPQLYHSVDSYSACDTPTPHALSVLSLTQTSLVGIHILVFPSSPQAFLLTFAEFPSYSFQPFLHFIKITLDSKPALHNTQSLLELIVPCTLYAPVDHPRHY